ncbi:GNAT family N-acetyltransferase [Calothrix membranacea FACHB-236]|nr:GNAT family N-acetyltransferase [Calothrix membranacea FACHB-236]
MPADFTIRHFQLQDRSDVAELMEELQDYERNLHSSRAPGELIANKHLAYLEKTVQQQNGRIYVAELNQEIIGFIVCCVEELEEGDLHLVEKERRYGYISDLYVLSKMRGKSVGVALIKTAEKHFLELDLEAVKVSLLHKNEAAANFYHNVGYQPYEVVYEKRLKS